MVCLIPVLCLATVIMTMIFVWSIGDYWGIYEKLDSQKKRFLILGLVRVTQWRYVVVFNLLGIGYMFLVDRLFKYLSPEHLGVIEFMYSNSHFYERLDDVFIRTLLFTIPPFVLLGIGLGLTFIPFWIKNMIEYNDKKQDAGATRY